MKARLRRLARWVYSGYDWPLYRDWLAWVGLAVTVVVMVFQVRRTDAWSLFAAPLAFAFYGWLLGAARNLVRGYRDKQTADIEMTRAVPRR